MYGLYLKGVSRICLDSGGSAFGVNGWRVLVERLDGPLMRFGVPEVISGGAAYVMRFGKLYTFGEGGAVLTVPVRVISQTYAAASMDALVTNVGLWGPVNLQVTVGNLTIYSQTQVITQPTVIRLPDFAGAIDQVLAAQPLSAAVDVPIQLTLDSAADVVLTNFSLVPARSIDVSIAPGDVAVGSPALGYTLTEGLTAPITATVRNSGTTDSGPLVVSFYSTPATRSGERAWRRRSSASIHPVGAGFERAGGRQRAGGHWVGHHRCHGHGDRDGRRGPVQPRAGNQQGQQQRRRGIEYPRASRCGRHAHRARR